MHVLLVVSGPQGSQLVCCLTSNAPPHEAILSALASVALLLYPGISLIPETRVDLRVLWSLNTMSQLLGAAPRNVNNVPV